VLDKIVSGSGEFSLVFTVLSLPSANSFPFPVLQFGRRDQVLFGRCLFGCLACLQTSPIDTLVDCASLSGRIGALSASAGQLLMAAASLIGYGGRPFYLLRMSSFAQLQGLSFSFPLPLLSLFPIRP